MRCRICGRQMRQTMGVHFLDGKWIQVKADYCFQHGSFILPEYLSEGKEVIPDPTIRDHIRPGLHVLIYPRENQLFQKTYEGFVGTILTKSFIHSRGIRVRLTDGKTGRIVKILE